jgi:heavy metal translocating P-type ATPase
MTCTLCGLDSGSTPFCCAGCENVYAILLASGVLASGQNFRETELYQNSLRLGLISNRSQSLPPVPGDAETREAVFHLSGLWCTSCGWLIEHALSRVRGVVSAEVLFASDLLRVTYAPQYLPKERIVERVASLGYRAQEDAQPGEHSDAERKDLLMRTGIAAFLSMNAMLFSLVVYASYFESITGPFGRYVPFVLMVLATPSVFYCGAPILRIAWAGLRERVLRMESLLALGILTAYLYSLVVAFQGGLHVYFDTACAIVTLVLTGKLIERGAKERTVRAIRLLYRLMPNKARVIVDGEERFVSVEALKPGTIFRVKTGERMPADGVVVAGNSHADESVLTGESAPRSKQPGDAVVCGSLNTGNPLEVRTTRAGADSTLAHVVRTVEQATAHRTKTERSVDRVARHFIPGVLALSALTWIISPPGHAMLRALAVIVIACPCALGIATPLALTAAVASAGKRGILVADTRVLETTRLVDLVVLDKTGTVTEGEFTLLEVTGDMGRMNELAAVENCSEHPIARALGPSRLQAVDVAVHKGLGISGVVNGTRYFLGNAPFMEAMLGPHKLRELPLSAGTMVYFGWDNAVRGAMVFGDRIRPEAAELCAALSKRGVRTLLLSGDSDAVTQATAAKIGADMCVADATPDRKIEIIREHQQKGEVVAMVGDGVNDAPALAQADLGIAMGSGADIAMQAAPLVLMKQSLSAVIDVLDLGRRTFRIVRQNLFWAFAYNTIGITLAMAGVLNPILAAAAMVLSSLSVIGNSRRL